MTYHYYCIAGIIPTNFLYSAQVKRLVEQHEAYFLLDQVFLYQKHISHQYQRWLYRFDAKGNILECFSIDGEEQLWSIRPPINQESIDGATFIFKDGILMLEK